MHASSAEVIVRLGSHSEKEYIIKTIQFFDGLIIGANLLEAMPWATASLLVRLCGRISNKAYYIDPMTYAFGTYRDSEDRLTSDLDWIKSNQKDKASNKIVRTFKRSYRSLSKSLGEPFPSALSRGRALTPSDFRNSNELKECCRRVVNYQLTRAKEILEADDELKNYAEEVPGPAVAFAPYFYIEPSQWEEWTEINLTLARTTAEVAKGPAIHAVVCADASFLHNPDFLHTLEAELPQLGVAAVWIWFSKLNELSAEQRTLAAFRGLVESLGQHMHVYNRHGGYFSLALSKYGMSGVSHGVGYGEQKDVVPVVGVAAPTVRYYLRDIHRRLGVPQIERSFDFFGIKSPADLHDSICDCVVCKGIVKDSLEQFKAFGDMHYATAESKRLSQTPAAAKRCRFHFMLSRIRERDWINTHSITDITGELHTSCQKWSKAPVVGTECDHLERWRSALQEPPQRIEK